MPRKTTGNYCWDGCGKPVAEGRDFVHGHDVSGAMKAIIIDWGGVKEFLAACGYGPGERDYSLEVTYMEHMMRDVNRKARPKRRNRAA